MKLPVVGKAHEAQAGDAPFHWFIYGSSLDRVAFGEWAHEHGYQVPDFTAARAARLPGHRLAYDVLSRFWGGFVGHPVPAEGEFVEGIALPLPATARGLVDHKEGAISGLYEPFDAEVVPTDGGAPFVASVYRAVAARRAAKEQPPAPRWVETVVAGARAFGLSDEWMKKLAP